MKRKSGSTSNQKDLPVYLFLLFIYLARSSDLLFGTSSSHLGFILVSMSASILINGRKDFVGFSTSLFTQFPKSTYGWRNSHINWPYFQLNQSIRVQLKRSARGQVLSIIFLVIFHDSSHELPVKFWIHIFWILHLPNKIKRWPVHNVTLVS